MRHRRVDFVFITAGFEVKEKEIFFIKNSTPVPLMKSCTLLSSFYNNFPHRTVAVVL